LNGHFFPAFVILLMVLNPLDCLARAQRNFSPADGPNNYLAIANSCAWPIGILLATVLLGQTMMNWFTLSLASVQVSSGIILFMLSVSMIFSTPARLASEVTTPGARNYISQLSCTAGPTVLANVLLLSASQIGHSLEMAMALASAILVGALLIFFCFRLRRQASFAMALNGCQKLMGLILTAIAIDRILMGVHHYFST
jgi:multiple antibiotic resistance protein